MRSIFHEEEDRTGQPPAECFKATAVGPPVVIGRVAPGGLYPPIPLCVSYSRVSVTLSVQTECRCYWDHPQVCDNRRKTAWRLKTMLIVLPSSIGRYVLPVSPASPSLTASSHEGTIQVTYMSVDHYTYRMEPGSSRLVASLPDQTGWNKGPLDLKSVSLTTPPRSRTSPKVPFADSPLLTDLPLGQQDIESSGGSSREYYWGFRRQLKEDITGRTTITSQWGFRRQLIKDITGRTTITCYWSFRRQFTEDITAPPCGLAGILQLCGVLPSGEAGNIDEPALQSSS
uniref:Uncharacterized protein n=1 Tax=Timema bartmani TaxID=61472 RepID=A0A7R9I499_9NEOP|nr:unnamed protein product [Timema bartmani]